MVHPHRIMPYPTATPAQTAFFAEHGWLIVEDALPGDLLTTLEQHCDTLLADKPRYAYDWAWAHDEPREARAFRIVQSSPSFVWRDIADAPYRHWMVAFGSALMGMPLEFWYDQFLGKPPRIGAATPWHQDEGYWGRNLLDRGITCWIPLIDVTTTNGCMHFIDRGHRDGILTHRSMDDVQSDLLVCEPDTSRSIACPIRRGSVTFHHSKMPHMTTPNISDGWRKAVSNHMQAVGAGGEGDHYPWKVYVNQRTGKRIVPPSR
jgi:phytanoyl-CoA hydroxylase